MEIHLDSSFANCSKYRMISVRILAPRKLFWTIRLRRSEKAVLILTARNSNPKNRCLILFLKWTLCTNGGFQTATNKSSVNIEFGQHLQISQCWMWSLFWEALRSLSCTAIWIGDGEGEHQPGTVHLPIKRCRTVQLESQLEFLSPFVID